MIEDANVSLDALGRTVPLGFAATVSRWTRLVSLCRWEVLVTLCRYDLRQECWTRLVPLCSGGLQGGCLASDAAALDLRQECLAGRG